MTLNSHWIPGIISSLAAFVLAYSIEGFRSLPLFWFLYLGLGAGCLALAVMRARDKTRSIFSIPTLLLLAGVTSLFANFIPLAFSLFSVFVNTMLTSPASRGWRTLRSAVESAIYVGAGFALVLIGGYMPQVLVPLAFALAAIAVLASMLNFRSGKSPGWPDAVAGVALLGVLLLCSEWRASVGVAAAAAAVALLIRAGTALKSRNARNYVAGAT